MLVSGVSTVVKLLPRHPEGKGLSTTTAAGTVRKKIADCLIVSLLYKISKLSLLQQNKLECSRRHKHLLSSLKFSE